MSTFPKQKPEVCPPVPADELLADRDINRFVMMYGRLPRIGDPVAPWHYRGWLLWYCQLCDNVPGTPGRWTYYLETFEAGKLLDKPIPQVEFSEHAPSKEAFKCINDCIDLIFHKLGSWSAFTAFLDWLSWGLATSKTEPSFEEELNEKLYRRFNLEHFLLVPYDYLGWKYSEGKGKWNRNAYYPTPHNLCELMARMVFGDVSDPLPDGRDRRLLTVMEPAVGSGRMLLHASNFSLSLFGQDIDPICCAITKINGALYAPWLTFPFPASIVPPRTGVEQGNSLVIPPPPAPLPCEQAYEYAKNGVPVFRIDDRGQGLLFVVPNLKGKVRP